MSLLSDVAGYRTKGDPSISEVKTGTT